MRTIRGEDLKEQFAVALVISRFNELVTQGLYESAIARLNELGLAEGNITCVWVPGAIEIPVTAQRLAKTASYDAIICLGAVIQGETQHFDYVCQQVSDGCQRVALENEIPVIFGVLTTQDDEHALARLDKGRYSVDAAVEMISVLRQIG